MKKTTFLLAVAMVWIAVVMVSCQSGEKSKFPGFSKTESGLYYKFYKKGNDTVTPKIGEYLDVVMLYGTDDSVLFDSRNLPELEQMQIPMIASVFQGDIYEGLAMMHPGDSASFIMPADSVWFKLFKMRLKPPGMDSVEYLTFDVKLNEILSEDTVKAREEVKRQKAMEQEAIDRAEYIAKNYPDAKPTSSGLYYIQVKKGKGKTPKEGQKVKVHYTGKFLDGTVFDSSKDRGKPIEFTIGKGQVIPGWDEGISMMRKGGKAVLIIPSNLAYGQGRGRIPPYSTLVFDVELVDILKNDQGSKK
ncbi:MAG: FKBP-type peptidyl-prolyl cis-trans isomerase [Chlorobi bacterium]|nr:FKBP-type peptidyl-prolyl cis-trans isomerase [Chlorobiota bacterium]